MDGNQSIATVRRARPANSRKENLSFKTFGVRFRGSYVVSAMATQIVKRLRAPSCRTGSNTDVRSSCRLENSAVFLIRSRACAKREYNGDAAMLRPVPG